MKHTNTRALYEYWESLRAGRPTPYRSEVDPRAIAWLLDSTFILERLDAHNTRFRLAGTRLCETFGMELRGMSALALWHGDCRSKVRDVFNRVVTEPCIGHVRCTVETRAGYLLDAEFLYLPLRSDFGDISRILGCGYYMSAEDIDLAAQEPLLHWVDRTAYYDIEAAARGDLDASAEIEFNQESGDGAAVASRDDLIDASSVRGAGDGAATPGASDGGASGARRLGDRRRSLRLLERQLAARREADAESDAATPALKAIDGGVDARRPLDADSEAEREARRGRRGHLKLIKSDAR